MVQRPVGTHSVRPSARSAYGRPLLITVLLLASASLIHHYLPAGTWPELILSTALVGMIWTGAVFVIGVSRPERDLIMSRLRAPRS